MGGHRVHRAVVITDQSILLAVDDDDAILVYDDVCVNMCDVSDEIIVSKVEYNNVQTL